MTPLERLADELAADYVRGRWQPDAAEERCARLLTVSGSDDGAPSAESIARAMRLHPAAASCRLAPLLSAYASGDPEAQDQVRELLAAIAADGGPPPPPRAERYVEPPTAYTGEAASVFLAGGITNCPDWQRRAVLRLDALGSLAVVFNPRREAYAFDRPEAAREQIAWEYAHLQRADVILFWFCAEAVQPIALYELGAHAARGSRIAVGTHPAYERRLDVTEQLRHARPDVPVHDSLDATVHTATTLLATAPRAHP
ncbi:nucleoside 2-deoxyribosyltransferase domain-containing protein [Streptomyces albicerus]|uniref:nucleoside 2-deoxyribosyltransferase domain-containing protein n=1 Tax=Streptomyces albicerus TaxID=2569859 RepID=UPI00124B688B|nr:nucleoside 2-deoxyribosyltransferase domain-containing protein [Streptomyces albicerus]